MIALNFLLLNLVIKFFFTVTYPLEVCLKYIEEVIANLKEATELYIEEFPINKTNPRILTTFEVLSA
ncbi:MAG TPA: hypothetical protein DCF68_04415 [Cyanothece sp. UBA12306]|nr:hypothetical protein [Cyanothece sp. UBA12306]